MDIMKKLDTAVAGIQSFSSERPDVGIILGSGLGSFGDRLKHAISIPFAEIPGFPRTYVSGHAGKLLLGRMGGVKLAILQGRVHFYEGHDMETVVFPVRALGHLGVHSIILTNAAGGIRPGFAAGDLMVIRDHINFMGANPLRGSNPEKLGPRFPDMSAVYDPSLREVTRGILVEMGLPVHEGVYAAMSGPAYETPAEIFMLAAMGADAVGMSTVPEAMAARHMGVRVAGISCITNLAAGIGEKKLSHEEVKETASRVRGNVEMLLQKMVERIPGR